MFIGCSLPVKALNVWMMPSQMPAGNSQLMLAVSLGTPKYPKSTGIHCLFFYICIYILHVHICKLFGKNAWYTCTYIYIYIIIYIIFIILNILYIYTYIPMILLFIAPPGWAAGASAAVTTQPLTWIRPCRSAVLSMAFHGFAADGSPSKIQEWAPIVMFEDWVFHHHLATIYLPSHHQKVVFKVFIPWEMGKFKDPSSMAPRNGHKVWPISHL